MKEYGRCQLDMYDRKIGSRACTDVPVKGWERVEAESADGSKDGVDGDGVWCDPRDPVEVGERLEERACVNADRSSDQFEDRC